MHGRRYSPDGFLLVFLNVKGNLSSVIMQLKDLFDSKLFGARCLSVKSMIEIMRHSGGYKSMGVRE